MKNNLFAVPQVSVDQYKFLNHIGFKFDHVFGEESSTEDLYASSVRPLVDFMVGGGGYATVFAYGQVSARTVRLRVRCSCDTPNGHVEKRVRRRRPGNATPPPLASPEGRPSSRLRPLAPRRSCTCALRCDAWCVWACARAATRGRAPRRPRPQTGSGKTYTMGQCQEMAVRDLFKALAKAKPAAR